MNKSQIEGVAGRKSGKVLKDMEHLAKVEDSRK